MITTQGFGEGHITVGGWGSGVTIAAPSDGLGGCVGSARFSESVASVVYAQRAQDLVLAHSAVTTTFCDE